MSDLLKEAIADAKAVRATALANAKAALEESFKPTLEAMLAEKLKSEIADLDPSGIGKGTKSPDLKSANDANPAPSHPNFDTDSDGTHPLRVGRYTYENIGEGEEEVTSEELDEILAELEREMGDEAAAPTPAPEAPVAVEPAAEVPSVAPEAPVAPAPAPVAPVAAEEVEEVDEEINLQELLDTLSEEVEEVDEAKKEDSEEEDKEEVKEQTEESVQLAEALNTVQFLRDQLNEINLLNAKLLYTNKLFNKFSLNQAQKMKVVETFDLTSSIREVKLSYKILSESLSSGGSAVKKPNTAAQTITEGLASKPVASTAPKKELIVENSNVMASRFQRLAGIKK
jgi:hypothetical protein